MCGRYSEAVGLSVLKSRFRLQKIETDPAPRYNLAPTQAAPVIVMKGKERCLTAMRWGLVPFWAKDLAIGNKLINARAESVSEKPAFKRSFLRKRALVPADGFYEWKKLSKGSVPYRIRLKSKDVFSFAGLWDTWTKPDGERLNSFTIVTTEANRVLRPIHSRMPVILNPDLEDIWLDASQTPSSLLPLLRPLEDEKVEVFRVSDLVNSPAHDTPDLLQPLPSPGPTALELPL